MQRRNVDLPEPDGPITHATSPGCTCRSTPRSTSVLPKLLWIPTASTIGWSCPSSVMSIPPSAPGQQARPVGPRRTPRP